MNNWQVYFPVLWIAVGIAASTSLPADEQIRSPITALTTSIDGKSVVVGSQAGVVIRTWPKLEKMAELTTELDNIQQLRFSSSGGELAIVGGTPGVSGSVEIYSWPKSALIARNQIAKDTITSAAWLDNSRLALGSLDHEITIWDFKANTIVKRLRGHSRGVTALTYLEQQDVLVSGSIDQNLRVWNAESWELKLTLNNHKNAVHQLALRPAVGLPMVASASDDGTVRFWQPTIGRLVRFAKIKTVPLTVEWLKDGSKAVAALADGSIVLVNPDDASVSKPIQAVSSWVYSVAVHPAGKHVLVGGRNGKLRAVVIPK